MSGITNLADQLEDAARECPEQAALISEGSACSFRELLLQTDRCARGLARIGIVPGMHTVLMVRPGLDFLMLSFALIRLGAVLVLVDPGMGWRNLKGCLAQARPEAFVGIPLAQLARSVLGWAVETVKLTVTAGGPRFPGSWSLKQVMRQGEAAGREGGRPVDPADRAAIVFTSGSTGPPKGVVYTHEMFLAQAGLLRDHFQIQPGEVDLATFPLFALFDPALRMTTVFPRMDFTRPARVDPAAVADPILQFRVTHLFASPVLLDKVGRYAEQQGLRFPSLRRVLSAGAPVQEKTIVRFGGLLGPEADVHTPYGATEALPISSIGRKEMSDGPRASPGKGVCVGRPLKGVQVEIIGIRDDPIPNWGNGLKVPPGEIGELVVWGPNVSREYFNRADADRLAKIQGPGGEIRHRMGDLGWIDEKGRIWFCGRKSQRVLTPRGVLPTLPCETIFNQHPSVYRSALVGVGPPGRQKPVLCVELEAGERGSAALERTLLEMGASYPEGRQIARVLFHPGFPVDVRHNAKIGREALAVWAAGECR